MSEMQLFFGFSCWPAQKANHKCVKNSALGPLSTKFKFLVSLWLLSVCLGWELYINMPEWTCRDLHAVLWDSGVTYSNPTEQSLPLQPICVLICGLKKHRFKIILHTWKILQFQVLTVLWSMGATWETNLWKIKQRKPRGLNTVQVCTFTKEDWIINSTFKSVHDL